MATSNSPGAKQGRSRSTGTAFTGFHQPEYVKPKRTRVASNLRVVICPDCEAEIGAPCVKADGSEKEAVHISRKRIALRKLRGD